MRRPSILSGIGMAFGLGLILLPLGRGLDAAFSSPAALRATLVICQLAYLAYLLRVAWPRAGIVSLMILNLALGLTFLGLPLVEHSLFLCWAAWLSLNRILLFHRSFWGAGLDLVCAGLGVLFLTYLLRGTGALPIALFGFYLVQSWAGSIPRCLGISPIQRTSSDSDSFQAPFRQAKSAIDQILKSLGQSP